MSWQEIQFGEAFQVKHGFAFKSQFFSDSGEYIVLTPGNFNEQGGFRLRPGKDRFYDGDLPTEYLLEEGDLIVAMTEQGPGLLGSSAWIPESGKYLHNQRLGKVEKLNRNILDPRFLYYLFNTRGVRGQISGSASGVKVRHTAPERIYRVTAKVPSDVSIQKEISRTLAAYDNLIENNRRRIQLLEQAARLLYKEWFVHLRFPGHEHVEIVDGVPEGWARKSIGDIAPFNYGKALKADNRVPGVFPVYGSSGVVGSHNKPLVTGPAIIVGRKGNVGSVFWCESGFHPIDTVFFVEPENSSIYLYYALLNTTFISTDVAVPGLNRNYAHSKELIIPADIIFSMFTEQAVVIHEQVDKLTKTNSRLSEARDLLLPRLMNGEITV